jgi:hypothetical protein
MDHEVDGGEMAEREAELRKRLRLPNGLIARATTKAFPAKVAKVKRKGREGKRSAKRGKVAA